MGSPAILILSSSAALQTRCFVSPLGAKECRCNITEHHYSVHHAAASANKQAIVGLKTDRLIAAKAGLGRYAGAIHGNSSKGKSRRTRPPVKQDELEECDKHQESTSDGEKLTQTQDQSDESTEARREACDAFAAEGLREEFAADEESESSQELSYDRYLMEMGISPKSAHDGESEAKSRDFVENLHGLPDESLSDNASQLSHQGHLQENGASSQVDYETGGRDLSAELTKEVNMKRASDAERDMSGKLEEKLETVTENDSKSENESIPTDEAARVAASEFSAPDHVAKTPSLNVDEDAVFGDDGEHTDKIVTAGQFAKEPDSVSDGGAIKKKRRKKPKTKPVLSPSLKSEEEGHNERVRASSGEAERPAVSSDRGSEDFVTMIGIVEAENIKAEEDFGIHEGSKSASTISSGADFFPGAEPADRDGQSSSALHSVVDSNSMKHANSEDEPPEFYVQDSSRLSFHRKAGTTTMSEYRVAPDEPGELMLARSSSVVGGEQPAQVGTQVVVETVLEQAVQTAVKVVPIEIVEQAAHVASKVAELPVVVVEQASQVGGEVAVKVVDILPDVVTEQVSQVADVVTEQVSQVADVVSEQVSQVAEAVNEQVSQVAEAVTEQVSQVAEVVTEQVSQVAEVVTEQVSQVVDQVTDFAEQVGQVVDQVTDFAEHVSDVAEQVATTVNDQVEQVADSVSSTASQVAEQVSNGVDNVTSTASQVVDQVTEFFTSDEEVDSDSDDEFETYKTSDLPEFRGQQGLANFVVKQEDHGVLSSIYDFYTYMLKQSFPKFAAAMFAAPILVSGVFTLLYLPEFEGLAFDETARDFFGTADGDSMTLEVSWKAIFQVFMFSLSLSTGLQPELAPLSPYALIVANLNALVAQLVFVFLSGAVFARLSQPSQPLRCSSVALVSASPAQRRRKENAIKVFMARYVLAGPQPCELVDVKIDLTYKYNTLTRTGTFFRATQTLKLVRPEIAFLTYGMLVRHVIDETSPLYQRTPEMLNKEDAVFCLSVVGLERASMQSVFHVQHYCVVDNHVIWDAEFEDIIMINKKNRRIVDHSRLSLWRPFSSI